jgi:GTPase SAR1 family protein
MAAIGSIACIARKDSRFNGGSNAFIFVFDLTNKASLTSIKGWYDDVKESIGDTFGDALIGNKYDSMDQIVVSAEEVGSVANELNLPYFQTSALTGENVDTVIHHFTKDFIAQS